MRRLVLLLVLANALMFGWNRGWFEAAVGPPTSVEENPHRLRPVPLSRLELPGGPPAAQAAKPKATPQRAAQQAQPLQQAAPPQAVQSPASQAQAPPASAPGNASMPLPGNASAPTSGNPSTPPPGNGSATTSGNVSAPTSGNSSAPQPRNSSAPPPGTAATAPAPADAAVPPSTPGIAPDSATQAPAPSAGLAFAACRAFAPIDEDRAAALRGALEQSGARVDARRIEQGASYLVYLPPAASAAEAQQRLVELRRIGRDDAFVIPDGPLRLAVSLGLFRFESAARTMVEQLARAGETRALVAPRPPIQVRIALQARWPQAEGAAIATMLGARFDAPARDCD